MRNSPYPSHTIGKVEHAIFPLERRQGLIQGIVGLEEVGRIDVADLTEYDLLAPGQVLTFKEPSRIDLAEFGGDHLRDGFRSEIKAYAIDLEPGAKLTGPLAWRPAEARIQEPVASEDDSRHVPYALAIILVMIGATAFMAPAMAAGVVCAIAFIAIVAFGLAAAARYRRKSIAKLGSVYVLAPKERLWARP